MIADHLLVESSSPGLCSAVGCSRGQMDILGKLSTYTTIASKLALVLGRPVMKSIETLSHGPSGTCKGCNNPAGLVAERLLRWHETQVRIY